jgi:acyl-CoA synthetase
VRHVRRDVSQETGAQPARPMNPGLVDFYYEQNWWRRETLGEYLAGRLTQLANTPIVVHSDTRPARTTAASVQGLSRKIAAGLKQAGVKPGDVVAFQMPNWLEAVALFYGAALGGHVVAPIPPHYGPSEVEFVCQDAKARILVGADTFGRVDYRNVLSEVAHTSPSVEEVFVLGEAPSGCRDFSELCDPRSTLDSPSHAHESEPAVLAYTSGTTAEPKGVIHSHRSVLAEVRQLGSVQPHAQPPMLVGAPIAHAIGMLSALLLPLALRRPIHLIDIWKPKRVLETMLLEKVTAGSGSPFFLKSLIEHPTFTQRHGDLLRFVGLGGAPVDDRFESMLVGRGMSVVRMYGSTEHPSTTGARHDDPSNLRQFTDGRPLSGVELRLAPTSDGVGALPEGVGEIFSRGPDLCEGYTDGLLNGYAFDEQGWYRTGDLGTIDQHGYLRVVGRRSELIIRGGENISALELETILKRLPGIEDVCVLGLPNATFGEIACACLCMSDEDATPSLREVRTFLERAGVSKQKWPERLEILKGMPRNATGKINRLELRRALSDGRDREPNAR